MKLAFVLLAVLTVQTSARIIHEASIRNDFAELIQPAKLKPCDDLPTKCLPLMKPAYEHAVKIRSIFRSGRALLTKLRDEVIKCYAMPEPDNMSKCLDDLKVAALAEGKPWVEHYLKARESAAEVLWKVEDCLNGKTVKPDSDEEVDQHTGTQCLPHVREGFETARKFHSITWDALKAAYYASEDYRWCQDNADNLTPEQEMECYVSVMRNVIREFAPIKRAYLKLRPQIIQAMDKFDTCMTA